MADRKLPIPIYKLALLQAYLYEMFAFENKCELNLKHTKWYLNQKLLPEETEEVISFLKDKGINCDCDLVRKLDLRDLTGSNFNFH